MEHYISRVAPSMRRYENRSTMMTSNRPIEEWGKLLSDVPAASAILDRLLHHAEIIPINGRSYRLQPKTKRPASPERSASSSSSPNPAYSVKINPEREGNDGITRSGNSLQEPSGTGESARERWQPPGSEHWRVVRDGGLKRMQRVQKPCDRASKY
jgi:hypothetical protein